MTLQLVQGVRSEWQLRKGKWCRGSEENGPSGWRPPEINSDPQSIVVVMAYFTAELSVSENQPPSNCFLEHDSAPTVPSAPLITSNRTPWGWAGAGDWRRAATA